VILAIVASIVREFGYAFTSDAVWKQAVLISRRFEKVLRHKTLFTGPELKSRGGTLLAPIIPTSFSRLLNDAIT
jgi:hypothetical protein